MRIWLSRINRHHSDRLAGPLTPFRRRDKPGSRRPVIQFKCIIAQDMTYCNTDRTISVSKQYVKNPNGELTLSRPKTETSVRKVSIPQEAVDLLVAEHKKHPNNPYMFPSPVTGEMYYPDFIVNLHKKILKDAGLPHIRFHDLRHTFATLALQNGVDVKTVSSMLGHYDAGFTLRTYTHATRQKQDEAAQTMGSFMAQVM